MLASVGPLLQRVESGENVGVPLALIAFLATWYAGWMVWASVRTGRAIAVYYAGSGAVWLSLMLVDGLFLLLGAVVFAPHCMESRRWGMAVVGLCAGGWLWQRWAVTGSLRWPELVIAAVIVLAGLATVGYVSSQARVSAERKRLLDELRAAQAARADAERRAGVAAERQRLARDIHDTLTQSLASTVMLLEAAEEMSRATDPARRHVAQALRSAREGLNESRRVVWSLRPAILEDAPFPGVFGQLADRLAEETGIGVETVTTGQALSLRSDVQTVLLRVAQEALSNVRKHSHATRASVTLSYMDATVVLDVQDDGVGFDAGNGACQREPLAGGFGLAAMRERVASLGGSLLVETAPGEGTTVVATLPVDAGGGATPELAAPKPVEEPSR